MTDLKDKYNSALNTIPAPGGAGCHTSLLAAANLGIMAGVEPAHLHQDLRSAIPAGGRHVTDKEIADAIRKAMQDIEPGQDGKQYRFKVSIPPKPKPVILPKLTRRLIDQASGISELELFEASPVRLTDDPREDWRLLIESLFKPADHIFVGSRYDTAIYKACDVLKWNEPPAELVGLNPFNEGGKRCDADVKEFRYCLAEFDELSIDEQIKFWVAAPLPVAALIFSGGKSIHCWIRLDGVDTFDDWQRVVKKDLYQKRLAPLGLDGACSNPSRMSRMPSYTRNNGNDQRLLYLNPNPDFTPILERI